MRRQVEKLPPLELLEQLEHEEEDGFYLYPKARGFDPITGLVL
jgi:hypothetical protein